ncbi:hypothetical protein ACG9X2_10630 [Acinetobacter bereziniae]|uniref:hypothetical protein n=1 Tax=Acinetobacter bereziniae TaxID=106648 RepID=UPI003AF992C6
MSEKTKFSTREWILSIIILLIVEAFVFWVAFQFAGNSSALGYVSFAGTIISIILAVLAIGYTYGESQQQKNSSETLSTQISSLVKIKDKLEKQADALEDIKELKNKMTEFSSNVYDRFKETNENFHEFKRNLINLNPQPSRIDEINNQFDKNQIFLKKLKDFNSTYTTIVFSVLAIYLDQAKAFDNYDEFSDFLEKFNYGNSETDAEDFLTKSELFSGCVMTSNILILMGLIVRGNNEVSLDEGLKEFLKICELRLQSQNNEGYNQSKLTNLLNELKKTSYLKL